MSSKLFSHGKCLFCLLKVQSYRFLNPLTWKNVLTVKSKKFFARGYSKQYYSTPKKFMTNFSLHICSSYCAYYHFKAKITERKLNRAEQMDIFFTLSHHYMSFISFDTKAFTTWQRKSLEVAKLLEEQKVVMWLMTLVLNSKGISKNIHSGQKSHYFVFATFFLERVTMWTLFKTMLSSFFQPPN